MDTSLTIGWAKDGAAARLALTRGEADRCARLPTAPRRSDFRAGRLAAKRAASGLLVACPKTRIEVSSRTDGTPSLTRLDARGDGRRIEVELSISHRDARGVAVVAPAGVRVGVDLERIGSVPMAMVRYFLTPTEQRMTTSVDPTILWSLKEAAWKALGLGRSVPFRSVELCADDAGRLLGVRVHGSFVPMHTRLSRPWPEFHMTTVWMTGGVA